MANINRQPLAEQDLIDIWLYTWSTWGETQADSYLEGMEKAFILLAEQPHLGRERKEFTPVVRSHRHAQHLIIYQIIENGINLVRVLHKSMDVNRLLESQQA